MVAMHNSNFGAGIVGPYGVRTARYVRPLGARPRAPIDFRRGFADGGMASAAGYMPTAPAGADSPWHPRYVFGNDFAWRQNRFNPGAGMSMLRAGMRPMQITSPSALIPHFADGGTTTGASAPPITASSPAVAQILQTLQRMRMMQPRQLDAAYQQVRQASPYITYNPKYATQFLQRQLQQQEMAPTQAAIQGSGGALQAAAGMAPTSAPSVPTANSMGVSTSSMMPSSMGYDEGGPVDAGYRLGGPIHRMGHGGSPRHFANGGSYGGYAAPANTTPITSVPLGPITSSTPMPVSASPGYSIPSYSSMPSAVPYSGTPTTDAYYMPAGGASVAMTNPELAASISSDQGINKNAGSDTSGGNWWSRNSNWALPALMLAGMIFGRKGSLANPAKARAMSMPPGWNRRLPPSTFSRTPVGSPLSSAQGYYTYGQMPEAPFFSNNVIPSTASLPVTAAHGGKIIDQEGNDLSGALEQAASRYIKGPGGGQDDDIDAKLSDGEYVMDATTVSDLGDGSNEEGARRMDRIRDKIAADKGRKHRVPPKARAPEHYVGRAKSGRR